jgi:hypothetical protein
MASGLSEPTFQIEQRDCCLGSFPALVFLGRISPHQRLGFIFNRQNAIANGNPIHRQRHDAARAFTRHNLEMISFATNDNANGNKAVIAPAFRSERDCAGDFQSTGNRYDFRLVARFFERSFGTRHEHVIQMIIKPCFNDQEFCHVSGLRNGAFAHDVDAIAIKANDITVRVGEQDHIVDAKVCQYLRANAVGAQIHLRGFLSTNFGSEGG